MPLIYKRLSEQSKVVHWRSTIHPFLVHCSLSFLTLIGILLASTLPSRFSYPLPHVKFEQDYSKESLRGWASNRFKKRLPIFFLFTQSGFQPSDWYSVKRTSIKSKKLWRYYSSLEEALRDIYPEYPWDPLQFARKRFRHTKDSLLQLITKAEQQLEIKQVKQTTLILQKVLARTSNSYGCFCYLSAIGLVFNHPR